MIYKSSQITEYLNRIDYGGDTTPTPETLSALISAHLMHIPYENLDILNKKPISLEAQGLYNKLILSRRGGYCFELNGLFSNLLESIGFNVINLAGRFILGENGIQARRHRILMVDINDKAYICDVGVRMEFARCALELSEGIIQTDGICEYKFEKDNFYGWIVLQKEYGREWRQVYGFTLEPQLNIDYVLPSFFCEHHPDSQFTDIIKVSVFTTDCHIGLEENILKIRRHGEFIKTVQFDNTYEISSALEQYFNIKIT